MRARSEIRGRAGAALTAVAVQVLIGWALIVGLGVRLPERAEEALELFSIAPEPPPPPEKPEPPPVRSTRPEGEAAPPNIRSTLKEIVAPTPIVVVPLPPPPVIAAPVADTGPDPSAGAADRPGPGTGAGGEGDGRGGGGSGDGEGGGEEIPLRQIAGRIRNGDYPRAALHAGIGGTVYLRFTVGVNGRVSNCTVTRSSGSRDLDETTCRLITKRFRYIPTRNARGQPVPDTVTGFHEWGMYRREELPEYEDR